MSKHLPSATELAEVWPPDREVACLAGHAVMSPMQAIRRKCLDCCCGQPAEVRLCQAVACPLWPFRSGRHPYTSAKAAVSPCEAATAGVSASPHTHRQSSPGRATGPVWATAGQVGSSGSGGS